MHSKKIALTVFMATIVSTAWAEPAIQAGDTLESLSQVKINIRTHSTTPAQAENNPAVTKQEPASEAVTQSVDVEAIDKPIVE
ncbi:hypothetical protein E0H88_06540 [Acinetobacter sp. ANC 4216]|uniref:hypothetical protein n=1 Tax=Acinetobacter sp. ANC 4216 TaxID=2529840 RepID=UPI00103AB2D4|nr:hypothetical protein [Acinetobacter sp. ANC 4216]TCB70965.1 hypothetical protein E0H88_06540 [Acinetobacter sp. ANC 4216]